MSLPAAWPRFVAVDWNGTVVPWFGCAPYPGALEALAALRQAGVFVAIVSHATPAQIQTDVARVGCAADEVHGVEGKAEVLQALKRRWGTGLMVGDSPQDARAAATAGLPFLQADFEASGAWTAGLGRLVDWAELPTFLDALGGHTP